VKTYIAWGVWTGTTMFPDFFRVRSNAQVYAGRRGMSGERFREISGRVDVPEFSGSWRTSRGIPAALWREYKRTHKGAKLVRVRVRRAAP
jgi:hypothetical protein